MVCRLVLTNALFLGFVAALTTADENATRSARAPDEIRENRTEGDTAKAEPAERDEDADEDAGEDEADRSIRVPGRNPRVLFITMKGCERCTRELARLRRPGGDFEAMRSRGWKIGESDESHLQIVDRSEIPELVAQLNVREYPTVACVEDGEIVRSFKHGCTTPLDAWTFGWLLKGKNERPRAPVLEPVRVESTGSYRLRGNHWSVDGDWSPSRDTLVSHLRGPNHASQLAASWRIESWSYEELRSLHDDLHERELGTSSSGNSSAGYNYDSESSGRMMNDFGAGRKMLGR